MICKNCEHEFEGNFCNNCGQKATVQPINFRYLIQEMSSSLFKMNKGIFFTIKELFIRPGHSIREFLEGKRKWHVKPFAFILLVSAVYVFIVYASGTKTLLGDGLEGLSRGLSHNGEDTFATISILNWLADNHAYATLLLLPIFALASHLAFIKSSYNYVEHVILNLYIAGQQMVIHLFFSLVFFQFAEEDFAQYIPLFLGIIYLYWAFSQFFESKSLLLKIFLTVVTYLLFTALLSLCLLLAAGFEALIRI